MKAQQDEQISIMSHKDCFYFLGLLDCCLDSEKIGISFCMDSLATGLIQVATEQIDKPLPVGFICQ